jgi:putative mRNA 3-end processing factor
VANGRQHWIKPEREGIWLPGCDVWIDPARPVETALITHGHADHARGGHGRSLATHETLEIMRARYGATTDPVTAPLGETIEIGDKTTATFFPAGHVLGSAQILLERAGERIVVTGDFKRRADPTCLPFVPVPCDILITEATFALPVFVHPPIEQEMARLLGALTENPGRCVLVGAYALGKAQRVIAELRRAGHSAPIYLHGAMQRLCELYIALGVDLGELRLVADASKEELAGHVVIAPPSALHDRWSRRLPDPLIAMASGWMRIRQRVVQKGVELPLIVSDHADWNELTETIRELAPQETWVTHGREDALVHWCQLRQMKARALDLVGYEDEDD